jgi:hypothetical protein
VSQTKAQLLDGSVVSVAFSAGSAVEPSLYFTGDTNTGIYSPGADQIAFVEGGVEALRIDSSGRVGIGTSAPISLLHIQGTSGTYPTATLNHSVLEVDGEILRVGRTDTATRYHSITAQQSAIAGGADNYLAFKIHNVVNTTAQTEVLRLTGNGRVGIGTSDPQATLQVGGSTSASQLRIFGGTAGSTYPELMLYGGSSAHNWTIRGNHNVDLRIAKGTLGSYGSDLVTITAAGAVGIGTTSPSSLIHGKATSAADVTYRLEPISNLYKSTLYISSVGSGDGGIQYDASNNNLRAFSYGDLIFNVGSANIAGAIGNERMRIDSSGRLLVGTSTARSNFFNNSIYSPIFQIEGANSEPSRFLSLTYGKNDASGPILVLSKHRSNSVGGNTIVQSGDEAGQISFQASDGTEFVEVASIGASVDGTPGANDMPGALGFSTTADNAASPMERMRIDSSGKLYVGTASGIPNPGFVVDPTGFNKIGNNAGANGWGFYDFLRSGTTIGSITQSGTTGVAYNTSSDYRLKENIIPVPDAIGRLQQLKPSRFNFKADPDRTVDGFIAHEAQAVVPECVTGEKDAVDDDGKPIHQAIDQSKLVPLLTAALQEAIAKIETLEARLTAAGID